MTYTIDTQFGFFQIRGIPNTLQWRLEYKSTKGDQWQFIDEQASPECLALIVGESKTGIGAWDERKPGRNELDFVLAKWPARL